MGFYAQGARAAIMSRRAASIVMLISRRLPRECFAMIITRNAWLSRSRAAASDAAAEDAPLPLTFWPPTSALRRAR